MVSSVFRRWAVGPVAGAALALSLASSASAAELPAPPQAVAETGGYSVWPDSVVPRSPVDVDTTPTVLGLEFSTARAGQVTAIEIYRAPEGAVPRAATLWSPRGRALAVAEVPDPEATGWLVAALDHPVTLRPGRRYVASYSAPAGRYAADNEALTVPVETGDLTAWRGVYSRGNGRPDLTYRQSNYYVDVVFEPAEEPDPEPGPDPAPGPDPDPDPGPDPAPGAFPDADTTGVPPGVTLTPYAGPCTIDVDGTVIDGRVVDCDLSIQASGVVIRNSVVNGTIGNDENTPGHDFVVSDSEVRVGDRVGTGIGSRDFVARRVEVTGGNRSINCWMDCRVEASYVHGQMSDETGVSHESGIRVGARSTIVGNTITCDAPDIPPDAGCSAGLTGYGDFAPVRDVLVQGNLFLPTTGGTCAYGGSSLGKPFSDEAGGIRFIDNVFQRGPTGKCGVWAPIMDFLGSLLGNVWEGNVWDDGTPVRP